MGEVQRLAIVASNDGEIDGAMPALIPPGKYQVSLSHWHTYKLFGKANKLALWFTVVEQGASFGVLIPRHYNVSKLIGTPGRGGRFKAPATGDLVRDYARILALPHRFDRFDLRALRSRVVLASVDTVKTSSRQAELAPACHYSVIRELLSCVA